MAGILDNKERIFDTIITDEGRRQLANGNLRIAFVSFSDSEVFYEADAVSGSSDPGSRIALEASNLPQDQITFLADDAGKLLPYKGSQLGILGGQLLTGSRDNYLQFVTSSDFASLSEELFADSIDNFKKLHSLGTIDLFADDNEFNLSTGSIKFYITNKGPIGPNQIKEISIDDVESFFQDKRLSHIPNFKYLPPVNKKSAIDPIGAKLGDYPRLGQKEILTYDELKKDLNGREKITVNFSDTSEQNNIMAQMFESKNNSLIKLDVIDFGDFTIEEDILNHKHVYFAGRVFTDGFGMRTFVNLFTLVFEG